jgi:recombination protein RecT
MSQVAEQESRQMQPYLKAIVDAKPKFGKQSHANMVSYDEEAGHAVEILMQNNFALKVAQQNPNSVERAVVKVAAIGLTLNRALAYAYLVPRDNQICLDISYKGLVKLATDSGSIKWAKAELVRENDTFEFNGIASEPVHKMQPFGERGEIVGVYCVAKTCDGDFLTDVMSMDDIKEVQSTSKAKNGPWQSFFGEMAKKTIIKRAQKQWPKGNDSRLETAIQVINEHEGLEDKENESQPDNYTLSGELVEPFFNAYFKDDAWLMFEVKDSCTDEQWPMLFDMLKKSDKKLTKKKKYIKDMAWRAQAQYIDLVDCLKQNKADGHEDGMINDLLADIPSEYWQDRLREVCDD